MKPVQELTFEEALVELEQMAKQMELGNIRLDDAIAIFERGNALKQHCETILKNAKMKIEKIQTATVAEEG